MTTKTMVHIHDAELALRQETYGILVGGMGVPVLDHVPSGTDFPYVEMGESLVTPWITKSSGGEEITLTFHVWSSYEGFLEAINLSSRLISLLMENDLSLIESQNVVSCSLVSREVTKEWTPNGIIRHGIVRFAWQIQKE